MGKKTFLALVVGCLMLLSGGCASNAVMHSTREFPAGTGFVKREFAFGGKTHPLWIFIPKDYNPAVRTPTIVFLHGLFEAGPDGGSLGGGLGPVIAEQPEKWPFLTVFPQSNGTWRGEDRDRLAIAALDYAQAHFSVDPDRVILAGLSYGGLGTWEIGARHPERFAALVPISGHLAIHHVDRLKALPIWAFSVKGDLFVPSQSSVQMCRAIGNSGGTARLTEFSGIGHDCWSLAVNESELVGWMLEQRRSPMRAVPDSTKTAVANVE